MLFPFVGFLQAVELVRLNATGDQPRPQTQGIATHLNLTRSSSTPSAKSAYYSPAIHRLFTTMLREKPPPTEKGNVRSGQAAVTSTNTSSTSAKPSVADPGRKDNQPTGKRLPISSSRGFAVQ